VTPFPARDFETARLRDYVIDPSKYGGLGGFVHAFDGEGNPIFNLDEKGFDGGGRVPLGPHALDVLFRLFLCGASVDIMDMGEKGQARHVSEAGDGAALHGEEDGWYHCDEEIAEDGIRIVPKDEIREESLVLVVVLHNLCVCGIVFV
jgi:hypothetical protein